MTLWLLGVDDDGGCCCCNLYYCGTVSYCFFEVWWMEVVWGCMGGGTIKKWNKTSPQWIGCLFLYLFALFASLCFPLSHTVGDYSRLHDWLISGYKR